MGSVSGMVGVARQCPDCNLSETKPISKLGQDL